MTEDDDFLFAVPSRAANARARVVKLAITALVACIALMALLVGGVRAETALAGLVRPNDMNSGSLLLPSKEPGFYLEAPRLKTDVVIDVSGTIMRARVTQRFENPTDGWVEGVYVFPLPEDAAVDTLKMRIGDRLVEGRIKPREEARAIYERARAEGRKAALMEQQRPNIFTNEVANIGPRETIVVQIEYQETVRMSDGRFSFRFPLVVAPRYSPLPVVQTVDFDGRKGFAVSDPVPDRNRIEAPVLDPRENAKVNPVSLTVNLAAGFPLGSVATPFHETTAEVHADGSRTYRLKAEEVPADRDFEMNWTATAGGTPTAGLFRQVLGGKTYLLAFVTPPTLPAEAPLAREVVFVIDNSGSMAGESIRQARESLALAISRLKPTDRFNVIRFDDTFDTFYPSLVPATAERREEAIARVRQLDAEGGTEMLPALEAALTRQGPVAPDALRQVVFLTDGAIGNEAQLFQAIDRDRGAARVFTVGIGSAPNSFFMARAAEIGRGTFTHVGSEAQIGERIGELFTKLENPVLTGIDVTLDGQALTALAPDPVPDLYAGEPVVLTAEIHGNDPKGLLSLTGMVGNRPWRAELSLSDAAAGSGIDKLWARRMIAALEVEAAADGADKPAVDARIQSIAMNHHLVSRMTSLVAVDVTPSRPADQPLESTKIPLNLPAGWDFGKVFGESEALPMPRQRDAGLAGPSTGTFATAGYRMVAAAPTAESAALFAAQPAAAVQLPQTATPARRDLLLGLFLILFAAMAYGTTRIWRGPHAPSAAEGGRPDAR